MTTKADVLTYLDENRDERGIAHWKQLEASKDLKSYGIGLTRLRKYAKTLRPNAKLAKALWKTKIYDTKILSLLIDDPKTMTVEQAETQVDQLHGGHLAHVFSSCDATLAKTPFAVELLDRWIHSKNRPRVQCGYGLLYEVSKWKKKSAPPETWYMAHLHHIDRTHKNQPTSTLMSMAGAVMGIGIRTKPLNAAALKLAKKIGPIDFDPKGRCDPFDITKKLTHAYTKSKLGL